MEDITISDAISDTSIIKSDLRIQELLLLADPILDFILAYASSCVLFTARSASRGNAPIGVLLISANPDENGIMEIKNVAVDESTEGRGIGRALLGRAELFAIRKGCRILEIRTGSSGFAPLALYQKVGFRMVAIDPDYFTRTYPEPMIEDGILLRDQIILQKVLGN